MPIGILSINGNKAMNYLIQTVLSNHYKVRCFPNALQAVRELEAKKEIEAVIIDLDYNLDANLEFMKYTENSSLFSRPFVVLSSDEGLKNLIPEGIVFDFIIKPFNPVNLAKRISLLISNPLLA